jgi:hypothetical protein
MILTDQGLKGCYPCIFLTEHGILLIKHGPELLTHLFTDTGKNVRRSKLNAFQSEAA